MRRYALFPLLLLFAVAVRASLPDFTDLIEENSPAVVKISTMKTMSASPNMQIPEGVPDIFREFFDQRRMPERNAYGMGSGFVISEDGYVLTNNHVVEGADEITVRLIDRREYTGEVVGTDPRSDLALVKIDAEGLPVARFAPADQLKVGEWVVAIGSPFGLDYSASVGVVSAIGRSLPTETGDNYVPFIQSDVAINPGNSGGPLFNLKGEVVGINSQIYTRTGGSIGLSFAIPSSVAQEVVRQLKENGRVQRGWLGVYIQDVDRDLASSLGLKKPRGALIAQVIADSPAEKAGLEAGDVVVRFGNKDIVESGDLPHEVGLMRPGAEARAEIIRDGKTRTLNVTVGALPDADGVVAGASPESAGEDALGLVVRELDRETMSTLRISGGVLVEQVKPDSPGQVAGLRPGDVIVQLGNKRISGIKDYREARKAVPTEVPVLIRFLRQGQFIFRTIEIAP